MSDLVGNSEDRVSHNEAQFGTAAQSAVIFPLSFCIVSPYFGTIMIGIRMFSFGVFFSAVLHASIANHYPMHNITSKRLLIFSSCESSIKPVCSDE